MSQSANRWRMPISPWVRAVPMAAAAFSGSATVGSATGAAAVDRVLRGGLAAAVAGAAATAPTWAVVVLATGAASLGLTGGSLAAASGLASLVLAVFLVWTGDEDGHLPKAASGALAVTALMRVPGGALGVTAAATGAFAALIVLTGVRGASPRWRRRGQLAAVGLFGLAAAATVLGAIAGLAARSSFEQSSKAVTNALDAARAGDSPRATESARAAAADLHLARSSLEAWWARPGWAVPVVGAHLRAADRVAGSAGPAVEAAAASAGALRIDVFRTEGGRLDLDRVSAVEPQLARLSKALQGAKRGAAGARSVWLVGSVHQRLDRYDTDLASLSRTSDRALLAVRTLPGLLGRDHPSRWFIAVANPAESREMGGFIGDYAILVADKGSIRLERSGKVTDIGANRPGRDLAGVDLPSRYLSQRPEVYWQNLTGYPDLPVVARAARALWDQVAPGSPIDGVVYVDPYGLAALLRLTGPVPGRAPLGALTAENVGHLLLVDQYARFDGAYDERKDALHDVADATFEALATRPLPGPGAIGDALGPAVRGGHLLASSFSADGQRLFDEVGAGGRLPAADGGDLASLRTTNLLANKLDAHIHRSVRYRAVVDPGTQRVEATATVELRSDATAGLPDYVAANARNLPKGTDLIEVAWYSGLELQAMEVNGHPAAATSDRERGWWTHSTTVEVPPDGSTTVTLRLAGRLANTRPYRLAVAPQAAAFDDDYVVEVVGGGGWAADTVHQPTPGQRSDLLVTLRRRTG